MAVWIDLSAGLREVEPAGVERNPVAIRTARSP
jgi:hypothetical protein